MSRNLRIGTTVVALVLAGGALAFGQAEEEKSEWSKTLSLGATATDGNSNTLNLNGALIGAREGEIQSTRLGVEANYAEAEDPDTGEDSITAQNVRLFGNYKYKFKPRWYAYTDNSFLHDEVGGLDYRIITGAGVGGFAIKDETVSLSLEIGAAYIHENYIAGSADNVDDAVAMRLAARHERVLSETARAWAALEILPKIDDVEDYLLNAEVGVEANVNNRLSVRLVLQERYDHEPTAGLEENDVTLIGSLVYTL